MGNIWENAMIYDNKEWRTDNMNENKELYTALSLAQGKVDNAKKLSKNPHFKSNYADLATIWDVIREPFTSEGLSILQLPFEAPVGAIGLMTILCHKSGQSIGEKFFLGLKDASNPQQVGSALTYAKRYALLGLAGIASEDDDGNAATGRPVPAAGPVDYTSTIAEAMTKLEASTDEEARQLYNTVYNSAIQETAKADLLKRMYDSIQSRKSTKGTK